MALPAYPGSIAKPDSWLQADPVDAYGHFQQLIDSTEELHVLDALPLDESGADSWNYKIRAEVIGERLWLLGYLDGSKEQARNLFINDKKDFLNAVSSFQSECDLKVDSWTGKQTWAALQGLVSFEGADDFGLARNTMGEYPTAVLRAFQLRLKILGLSSEGPERHFKSLDHDALVKFRRILQSLKLLDFKQKNTQGLLDETTVQYLLDHDRIVNQVASLSSQNPSDEWIYRFYIDKSWSKANHLETMRRFLVQLAKIELWLLGSDISLSDEQDYSVLHFEGKKPLLNPKENAFGAALVSFYLNLMDKDEQEAVKFARTIRPEFFRDVQQQGLNTQSENILDEKDIGAEVLQKLNNQSSIDQALDEGKSLGMRLWDGIKRIWRWFKNKVSAIFEFGKNVVRAFYRYASKGYQILKRAVRACVETVETWVSGAIVVPENNSGVLISKDFDMQMLIGKAYVSTGDTIGLRTRLYATRFMFAAQIASLIMRGLMTGALQQWARFAKVLVSGLRDIFPLYRELQKVENDLAAIATLT